jgi:hypothetical protein
MGKSHIKPKSIYAESCIIITTKHAKSEAVIQPFWEILGASVIEYVVDTDKLGTFSGEVERQGTALECAKRKCEWSHATLGAKATYFLASEGSFGPHPLIPFMPCDHEILYFIDKKRDFHLHLSLLSEKTNYQMQEIDSLEELQLFASQAKFPSHALILKPMNIDNPMIFKGLYTEEALGNAFTECKKLSNKLWVETDMRAHMNPSRMNFINQLATNLATRLKAYCPSCDMPGWGKIDIAKGLECSCCGLKTEMVRHEIFGCTKCEYRETKERSDGLKYADPGQCQYCNP